MFTIAGADHPASLAFLVAGQNVVTPCAVGLTEAADQSAEVDRIAEVDPTWGAVRILVVDLIAVADQTVAVDLNVGEVQDGLVPNVFPVAIQFVAVPNVFQVVIQFEVAPNVFQVVIRLVVVQNVLLFQHCPVAMVLLVLRAARSAVVARGALATGEVVHLAGAGVDSVVLVRQSAAPNVVTVRP